MKLTCLCTAICAGACADCTILVNHLALSEKVAGSWFRIVTNPVALIRSHAGFFALLN